MQELALFVLPQNDENSNGDSNRNEVHVSSTESLLSNHSLDEEENDSQFSEIKRLLDYYATHHKGMRSTQGLSKYTNSMFPAELDERATSEENEISANTRLFEAWKGG